MTQTTLLKSEDSVDIGALARDATVALILQVSGDALTYLLQFALIWWMGVSEYGVYSYAISWSSLLGIFAALGLPHAVLRFVSEYKVQKNWGLLRGVIWGSWRLTFISGCVFCLVGTAVVFIIRQYYESQYITPVLIGIWAVLLQALSQLQLESSRALGDIKLAFAPSRILWPVLILVGGFFLFGKNHFFNSLTAITWATLMLLGVVCLQLWLLRRKLNQTVEPATPIYTYGDWLKLALPLLFQSAFIVILFRIDILMIGSLVSPEAAGVYSAASNTAVWVAFCLQIINIVAAPAFATLHAQGDRQGLQTVVSNTSLWVLWPSLIIAAILIIFSRPILAMFGPEFVAAEWVLKTLVIGELINVLFGPVSFLLGMTGHQNKSAMVFGFSALINLILNPIGIMFFGILGSAMATVFSMFVWKVWLSILAKKNVGVHSWALYGLFNLEEKRNQEKHAP
ncbi:flippase [Nodularia spumigena]|uniref:flippase n=1 Tax=Nodularia spumigena TaxID=70799 RepID=UPI00232C2715|nr:flippase [Nodularia spumigena]MDB9317735.1 flippase [Nodularia spumigena CS-590/01A]MDB9322846.1 flippase [Nodularia spumigena CS-591/07A]MDB9325834.1 flippase [Nodularia spumigena CS-590/02]MDB9330338.1 flippase [Nodularia spumigena CS-591/04]MDB9336670.1 flippase [Nodularia spumigena CS-590/01]